MSRLRQPDELDDPLTEILRQGARRLLAKAVEQEAEARRCINWSRQSWQRLAKRRQSMRRSAIFPRSIRLNRFCRLVRPTTS
ncbi:MAG TPA: hypothetical protein DCQ35_10710 [Rhodospirillum rubrum]|nr:hypothetical protein [Rhodospirillum rubrum]